MPATSAATASESTSAASRKTESVRSRLAPISEKPLPVSQARSCERETRQGEQPHHHKRIPADAEIRGAGGHGNEEDGDAHRASNDEGSEPVDERRALDGDRGLAPQASQVAVRLERRRPASTLKPSLPVLYQAGQQRSRGDAPPT